MNLKFYGAAETVTGSKTLVTIDKRTLLIDCGLFQGYKNLRLKNWQPPSFSCKNLDAVILTHAHLDHSGYLPILHKNGFKGPIYCSPGTAELLEILLYDSAKIQEEDASYANRKGFSKHKPALPLYTSDDVAEVLSKVETIAFDKEVELFKNVRVTLRPAGHIIGSSIVSIDAGGQTLTFSGDLGRFEDHVMNAPSPLSKSDYVVLESTYGNRKHNGAHPEQELAKIILEAFQRGGEVLIPAFAVGRTQKVLYHIINLINHGVIPRVPIYLDSPMGINASEIFCKFHREHKLSADSCRNVFDKAIIARSQQESMNIATTHGPKIVISSSGMASGGRVLHHLKRVLPETKNAVIFTGYQAGGTRGAKLLAGEPTVKIHGMFVPVNASIHNIEGMSAHADYIDLLNWIEQSPVIPKTVFLNHGEPLALESLRDKFKSKFPELKVIIPNESQEYTLN
jgi:metallo-beta-lactamase family protein